MQGNKQIMLISLFALLLRWCVTYHSYSGEGKPPLFGDYEAQRHWQEITFNLPVENWYINTTDNDLQYWGLDYPPLTAYHSFILGYVADKINFSYISLYESRGFSSESHKYFMRLSVLLADILVYLPAIIYFACTNQISNAETKETNIFGFDRKDIVILIMLIYPGLILIDHGHFQYNCISLGLFIGAVATMLRNSFIFGSFLFVAALNYKQMELYHALPIFLYILGKHLSLRKEFSLSNIGMLLCISFIVIFTFIIMWLPYIKNLETFASVMIRLFPVARGIFEDKVANVWCAINILYKLRNTFTNIQLAKICLVITTVAILPSCINIYLHPEKEKFIISLINCALSFFLFSFQVHEKSILLVAIPVLLHFQNDPFPCFWFLIISHFSMLPLFMKDNLYSAYWITLIFFILITLWVYPDILNYNKLLANKTPKPNVQKRIKTKLLRNNKSKSVFTRMKKDVIYYYKNNFIIVLKYDLLLNMLFYSSIIGIIMLSIVSGFLEPPKKYPDLFPLLVSVYSCGHFIVFYVYFNYKQLCV
ncbi:dolichyl pyrophosphate Man9GlcNAc2 alpha-1,3-glucosyltransferase [Nomia melanderi]|uniref:dolichyl pyrophosphate Man9GlcNAc2 alpha-1,3-glucosyltransferase n=1 Tax=Nomia melanderi TaxID=2448451 RepID=UPI0013042ADF|nr:dolichyl pyrophosphate Man9GlcNAc2 alpha-1,3-glucosyltransferase [Nomia melanderi]